MVWNIYLPLIAVEHYIIHKLCINTSTARRCVEIITRITIHYKKDNLTGRYLFKLLLKLYTLAFRMQYLRQFSARKRINTFFCQSNRACGHVCSFMKAEKLMYRMIPNILRTTIPTPEPISIVIRLNFIY